MNSASPKLFWLLTPTIMPANVSAPYHSALCLHSACALTSPLKKVFGLGWTCTCSHRVAIHVRLYVVLLNRCCCRNYSLADRSSHQHTAFSNCWITKNSVWREASRSLQGVNILGEVTQEQLMVSPKSPVAFPVWFVVLAGKTKHCGSWGSQVWSWLCEFEPVVAGSPIFKSWLWGIISVSCQLLWIVHEP